MTDDSRDPRPDDAPDDPGANTERFRAFAERDEPAPARPVGAAFRIWTLLIGLVVFAGIVWLLLR